MKIAITGATGQLGRLVVGKLKQKIAPENIIALARSSQKASDLGVEVRQANYTEPATLEAALEGVNTLLLISSSEVGQRAQQHANVIEAAKKTGVSRIVYTSLLNANVSSLSLAGEHLETENLLQDSGISFTILRNGWYTENYTGSVAAALAGGAFIGSAGEGKISSAARADFAEAAVAVLTNNGHANKLYELAGDNSYTLSDLAAEISLQSGVEIPYKNLQEADYAGTLAGFGLPAEFAQAIASFDAAAAGGALFSESSQLSTLIGRPTTPLATVVADALKG